MHVCAYKCTNVSHYYLSICWETAPHHSNIRVKYVRMCIQLQRYFTSKLSVCLCLYVESLAKAQISAHEEMTIIYKTVGSVVQTTALAAKKPIR